MTTLTLDTQLAQVPHVDPDQLARLRAALSTDRIAQAVLTAEHQATVTELTGQMDVDSILERELAEAATARARQAMQDIDAALARMDGNTYGNCRSCGGAILPERLEAIPHTRFCVACPGQGSNFLE